MDVALKRDDLHVSGQGALRHGAPVTDKASDQAFEATEQVERVLPLLIFMTIEQFIENEVKGNDVMLFKKGK
jgi:hypothetical protein